jgi:uncharacterized protein with PIN domain
LTRIPNEARESAAQREIYLERSARKNSTDTQSVGVETKLEIVERLKSLRDERANTTNKKEREQEAARASWHQKRKRHNSRARKALQRMGKGRSHT